VADDIPARPEESPIRAAPVTVPVSPAAVAEILTEDGEITLPPVPGSTVTISARNVTSRAPGGDPLACLARALQSARVPASAQLPRSPHARLWGVGTNVQERLSALGFPQPSPFRPDDPAGRRPVKQASRAPAARPVRPPRPPGR